MARPRIQNRNDIKIKVNLTITPQQREQLATLAQEKGISASELFGKWIEREFKASEKKKKKAD